MKNIYFIVKIFLFVSGFVLVQQNLIAAENVPPPPPLPSADKSIKGQDPVTGPAPKPAPIPVPEVGQTGKSIATIPGNKKKNRLKTELTIIPKKSETRTEYRAGGILYMIKITPKGGRPFYLVDLRGDGVFVRSDLTQKAVIPMWLSEQF